MYIRHVYNQQANRLFTYTIRRKGYKKAQTHTQVLNIVFNVGLWLPEDMKIYLHLREKDKKSPPNLFLFV